MGNDLFSFLSYHFLNNYPEKNHPKNSNGNRLKKIDESSDLKNSVLYTNIYMSQTSVLMKKERKCSPKVNFPGEHAFGSQARKTKRK